MVRCWFCYFSSDTLLRAISNEFMTEIQIAQRINFVSKHFISLQLPSCIHVENGITVIIDMKSNCGCSCMICWCNNWIKLNETIWSQIFFCSFCQKGINFFARFPLLPKFDKTMALFFLVRLLFNIKWIIQN